MIRCKVQGWSISLVLVAFASLMSHAAPVVSNMTVNSTSVERYGKFELTFNLASNYTNPFDSDEIRVDAAFTTPSGKTLIQPGFFYREYERSLSAGESQVLDPVVGSDCWKVRFAPQEVGTYSYVLSATDSTGRRTMPAQSFTSLASSRKGFVRADGYRLKFDDGSPYFPIGASVSWSQQFSDEHRYYKWGYGYDSTYGFDASFAEYGRYGGNWDRLWIDTGDWAVPSIEGRKSYWNIYPWQLEDTFGHSGNNCGRIENFAELRPYLAEPYALADGQTLTIRVNGTLVETITFRTADFTALGANIANAGADDVAAVFNGKSQYASMVPQLHNGEWYARIRAHPAAADVNSLEVTGGTAASKFNFPTTVARPSMNVELRYKEFSGGWRVEGGKTYRFSCWMKTTNLQAGTGGGINFRTQYFQSPFLSGTQNWTYWEKIWTAPQNTRLELICTMANAAGQAWFDDFSLKEVGSTVELGQDGGFEYETLMLNRYNLPDAWALDYILGIAEQHDIYIQLMIGRHGQPDASYQKYLRYLVGRWGYSPHVLSWEFENENWHDMAWHHRMSLFLESLDAHNHLRTTSLWSGLVDPDLWGLPGLTLVNLHHYRKDAYTPRIWGMLASDPRMDHAAYHSSNTSVKLTPGDWAPSGPFVDVAPGGRYTLRYWVKGDNVDADATAIQIYYVDKNHNEIYGIQGPTFQGTYNWTQVTAAFTAPADAIQVRFYSQSAGLRSGIFRFDDLELVRDSDGIVIFSTDFEFSNYKRYEDWAHYGFSDGKLMRSYQFIKPNIGGEHGLEHVYGYYLQSPYINGQVNGVTDVNVSDPSFQWDQAGVNFHNWLWGTAMGGMSGATGMWWYVNNSHRHYLALSEFVGACPDDFVTLNSSKSTTPGDLIASSNPQVYAFGKTASDRAYIYLMNADHCWNRLFRDHVVPTAQNAIITIKNLVPGSYRVEWWNTYYTDTSRGTNPVTRTEVLIADALGKLTINVTNLLSDTAVRIDPLSSGTPTPRPSPRPTETPPPPTGAALYESRINCGGPAYVDTQGRLWSADRAFAPGGAGYVGGSSGQTANSIDNTVDDVLYQSERWAQTSYLFVVPPGEYEVTLHFAEIYYDGLNKGGIGARIFDVNLEHGLVLDDVDLFALVGSYRAYSETHSAIVVDGLLNIDFSASVDHPKISAIEIRQLTYMPSSVEPDSWGKYR